MTSSNQHVFSAVPKAQMPRSSFNRSHGHKTTFDAGYLIPIYVDEALPGDTFALKMTAFARLATPLFPLMDNLYMDFFFFAVPNRLVWGNWQRFMGERAPTPTSSIDYVVPQLTAPSGGYLEETIWDYLGLPTKVAGYKHSVLPLRAYNLIWNEWFRDQNLQDMEPFFTGDSAEAYTYKLLRRGKRHDYFTSALPWAQKGTPVEIPLGTSAPIVGASGYTPTWLLGNQTTPVPMTVPPGTPATSENVLIVNTDGTGGNVRWGDPALVADLSGATAATINSLRQAFQIQRLLERDARGGTRYTEILRSHFGVISPDARLQRPEYLGGGSVPIVVNPVTQTSDTPSTATPSNVKGSLAAYAVAGAHGIGFTKSFTEHMIILGLVSVRADMNYQYGLNRMWSRETRYDFYWPVFAHLGEQAVLNKEIWTTGTSSDDQAFGYQERWAEYRYYPGQITGKFRSNAAQSLDSWHLAQAYTNQPALVPLWIEDHTDSIIDRVVAVPSEPNILFDSHFSIKCARPMPTYSVPGFIDHF